MPLAPDRLRDIVAELVTRPQHEKVRSLIYELLVNGLNASSTEVSFETRIPEVHGRIDALLGRTIFEFKSDLRRESADAEEELTRYLTQRETQTKKRFVGVATDGATFVPYELRDGALRRLSEFVTTTANPRELLAWLSSVVAVSADLDPTPETVTRELGRASPAWQIAALELRRLWAEVGHRPDVRLKRGLWSRLMERVYGTSVDDDALFFQHTYLSIIAKTLATHVLGVDMPNPADLLNGSRFEEAGIGGAVEPDFFDWTLAATAGGDLVRRVALQAARFRLRDVETDVLKGLYESLVDPEQRHFLGEYYTPDWLAQRICEQATERPLQQRVLDPACGSGTFLFHSVRRLLAAAETNGIPIHEAVALASSKVFGIDIHPVAVQIARVTFLLALGSDRLRHRPTRMTVPVYMGDSLQWNTSGFLADRLVEINVPDGPPLEFPFEVARDPNLFDAIIARMLDLSKQDAPPDGLRNWLERTHELAASTITSLTTTYGILRELNNSGRNHIWGFVARNLARPLWLSQDEQRADVILGNPPWLAYRFMATEQQQRFHDESQRRGLWMGQVAQQQDLSAYFFVRCVELYLKATGKIAFVMPMAAMTRRQFAGFRTGVYGERTGGTRHVYASIHFTSAWMFSDDASPLFPVPSCVLFAENESHPERLGGAPRLPANIMAASGNLPRRNATLAEAEKYLSWQEAPWPEERRDRITAGYASRFRQGAILIPRVLFTVEETAAGILGANPVAPVVESRRTSQEKLPWKDVPSLRGNIEKEFLRPAYLGESIAPFRLLNPVLAVIPVHPADSRLIDAEQAQRAGFAHLARWLGNAERVWAEVGRGKWSLLEQLDFYGQFMAQFPIAPIRVVYAKAGTLPAASVLRNSLAVIDHKLYWAPVNTIEEGLYLTAILNSETSRARAEHLQSRGQWGARDFDKVILSLPIPDFNPALALHRNLVREAQEATEIASAVELPERSHFVRARQAVRAALAESGVSARIDGLVERLLSPGTPGKPS